MLTGNSRKSHAAFRRSGSSNFAGALLRSMQSRSPKDRTGQTHHIEGTMRVIAKVVATAKGAKRSRPSSACGDAPGWTSQRARKLRVNSLPPLTAGRTLIRLLPQEPYVAHYFERPFFSVGGRHRKMANHSAPRAACGLSQIVNRRPTASFRPSRGRAPPLTLPSVRDITSANHLCEKSRRCRGRLDHIVHRDGRPWMPARTLKRKCCARNRWTEPSPSRPFADRLSGSQRLKSQGGRGPPAG
jgi:hypothetical protein